MPPVTTIAEMVKVAEALVASARSTGRHGAQVAATERVLKDVKYGSITGSSQLAVRLEDAGLVARMAEDAVALRALIDQARSSVTPAEILSRAVENVLGRHYNGPYSTTVGFDMELSFANADTSRSARAVVGRFQAGQIDEAGALDELGKIFFEGAMIEVRAMVDAAKKGNAPIGFWGEGVQKLGQARNAVVSRMLEAKNISPLDRAVLGVIQGEMEGYVGTSVRLGLETLASEVAGRTRVGRDSCVAAIQRIVESINAGLEQAAGSPQIFFY